MLSSSVVTYSAPCAPLATRRHIPTSSRCDLYGMPSLCGSALGDLIKWHVACHRRHFFGNVDEAALAQLDPRARMHATGAWRVTSQDLGRVRKTAYH